MKVSAILSAIYTLSQTHCGTGQAGHAVDLPIARESSTKLPILPATTLKGVARATIEATLRDPQNTINLNGFTTKDLIGLFGSELGTSAEDENTSKSDKLTAGALVLGEGHLLAYPFRALHQPLVFGTCPLALERLDRVQRANALPSPLSVKRDDCSNLSILTHLVKMRDNELWVPQKISGPIILEDRIFTTEHVKSSNVVAAVGEILAGYLPEEETATSRRLSVSLAIIPDALFCQLIRRVTPVQARIKLTSGKTTGVYKDPVTQKEEKGNLWYEETLPSDCLFWSLIQHRTGKPMLGDKTVINRFEEVTPALRYVQIGGNETVGQGQCLWHFMGK